MEDPDTDSDMTRGIYRRIYAGFIYGKRINAVSLDTEMFFWRLHAVADDFGNFHGEPALIRDATQGRRKFTVQLIDRWLDELVSTELVARYSVGGDSYIHIVGFEVRQPANRNGRRIKRFPLFVASGGIQVNPGESCASAPSESKSKSDSESKSKPPARAAPEIPESLDSQEFRDAWAEWCQHRREKRKPITPTQQSRALKELSKLGRDRAIAAIEYSISKGWQGVYEEKENGHGKPKPTPAERGQFPETDLSLPVFGAKSVGGGS